MNDRSAGLLLVFALLAGCASQPIGKHDLVNFLSSGQTDRDEIYLKLGDPSAIYEGGRIVTYRLAKDEGGYFLLQKGPGFQSVIYSLVLVFDETGKLARHALVQVRAP